MKATHFPRRLVVLFAIIFLLPSVKSFAGTDVKYYPGIACHGYSHYESTYLIYNFDGRIENDNADTRMDVICPAINDHGDTTTSATYIYVLDLNNNTGVSCDAYGCNIYCTMVNHSTTSLTFEYSDEQHTTGSNSSVQYLSFDALSSGAGYMRFMYCRIPYKDEGNLSAIVEYQITENVP
mgnify:CR=1 FL=1